MQVICSPVLPDFRKKKRIFSLKISRLGLFVLVVGATAGIERNCDGFFSEHSAFPYQYHSTSTAYLPLRAAITRRTNGPTLGTFKRQRFLGNRGSLDRKSTFDVYNKISLIYI